MQGVLPESIEDARSAYELETGVLGNHDKMGKSIIFYIINYIIV